MRGNTRQRTGSGSRRHQRGAVAVFVAVGIVALVASLLLVIDIGRLYYAQRQLQLDANMAALAGAQAGSGCLKAAGGVPGNADAITAAVWQSLNANTPAGTNSISYVGTPPAEGSLSVWDPSRGAAFSTPSLAAQIKGVSTTNLSAAPGSMAAAIEVGQVAAVPSGGVLTNTFQPLQVGDSSVDAVRVTLAAHTPTSFLAHFFGNGSSGGVLYASATARQQALGSFYLGTGLVNLSGGLLNQILGGLLCPAGDTACQGKVLALNLASFNGLANVGVSLGQLAIATGLQVKDLTDPVEIQTKTPLLSDVLNSLATQLSGTANATVISTLQGLASAVQGSGQTIPLGLILKPVGTVAANVPFIDLKDLILGLGEATHVDPNHPNQVTPIQLPVNLDIPSTLNIQALLSLGKPPVFSGLVPAGSPQATQQTSEATLMVRIKAGALVTDIGKLVSGALLGLVQVAPDGLNVGIDVALAPATASLNKLVCPSSISDPSATLEASSGIAEVNVGSFTDADEDSPLPAGSKTDLTVLAIPSLGVNLGLSVAAKNKNVADVGAGAGNGSTTVTQFKACGQPDDSSGGDSSNCSNAEDNTPPAYFLANGAAQAPPPTAENPLTVGSGVAVSLTGRLSESDCSGGLLKQVVCGLANTLLSTVNGLVQPLASLINGLADSLINPVLETLGLNLGNATVTMNTATFGQPVVVTNCLPGVTGAKGCPPVPAPTTGT